VNAGVFAPLDPIGAKFEQPAPEQRSTEKLVSSDELSVHDSAIELVDCADAFSPVGAAGGVGPELDVVADAVFEYVDDSPLFALTARTR
jgi:hypothetical protein